MARLPITSLRSLSEINLTPLMDLSFLLLVTFIITFPLIEQGIQVDLPRGEADELSADRARTITIDKAGRLYLDDAPIEPAALAEAMKGLGETAAGVTVMVRADQNVRYAEVVRVLKILHDARIDRMALVTRADEGPGP
ncbi:MAG: biopolymer transporter ExbD [Lentisphaerae bacterium]|nr:biopolymer transporter ExbD [Lentisphaerota bacterium]